MALTISLDTTNSEIKATSSVVRMLNPLPLVIDCSGGTDFRCFATIYKYVSGARSTQIASGLELMEVSTNKFIIDLQDVFSSQYDIADTPFKWYNYEIVIQAQSGTTYTTQSYYCYCLPYTTQFGTSAYIGALSDSDIISKCNQDETRYGVTGVSIPLQYVSSTSVMSTSDVTYDTAGTYTQTIGGKTYTFVVSKSCESDLIVRYLDNRSKWRLIPIGNYYTETIDADDATTTLQPYVNLSTSLGDKYNVHRNATKKLAVTVKNVSREQMNVLQDLIYSPRVMLKNGDGSYVLVDAECSNTIFQTKKQFTDVTITFTMPKMYTI